MIMVVKPEKSNKEDDMAGLKIGQRGRARLAKRKARKAAKAQLKSAPRSVSGKKSSARKIAKAAVKTVSKPIKGTMGGGIASKSNGSAWGVVGKTLKGIMTGR